jgi:RND family efflux transporter MFP subunit
MSLAMHLPTKPSALILASIAATSLFALSACGSSAVHDRSGQAAPLSVDTAIATLEQVAEPIEAGGVVAARATAVVTSRVVAPVANVRVRAGDRVRAGQVLVMLDAGALAAQAEQAMAAAGAAEQALVAARTEYAASDADRQLADAWHARIAALHTRRAATRQELDEAETRRTGAAARTTGAQARIDQATSQLAAARAAADAAQTTHGFIAIRAPFAGLVTERMIDPGNLASPAVPLLRLDADGAPRVEARVDEARAGLVRPGDNVEVLLDAVNTTLEGVVDEVARAVAADERAFTIKVSLPRNHAVRTGTFARVRFRGPSRNALLVPASALRRQGQVATVFVVKDAMAHLRLVQPGIVTDGRAEVLAGLDPGEVVVANPPAALADGRHVTPKSRPFEGEGR